MKARAAARGRRAQGPPAVGALFLVPLPEGRCGAARVVRGEEGTTTFLVLDWFGDDAVSAEELLAATFMATPFDGYSGLHDDVFKGWFQGAWPADFRVVAHADPSPAAARLARPQGTMIFQSAEHFRRELHKQWRWLNDRVALQREWRDAAAEREREAATRKAERRAGLTLESFARERAFAEFRGAWPATALQGVRRIFRDAALELAALGERADRDTRVAVLKTITTRLNELDDPIGFIETVERELLVARVRELAALVGIASDDEEELTGHRDW